MLYAQLMHEVVHVAYTRAAKGVDALVVVAHGKDGVGGNARVLVGAAGIGGKEFEPEVLQAVGVLKFINQYVPEAALVVLAHEWVVAQDFVAA